MRREDSLKKRLQEENVAKVEDDLLEDIESRFKRLKELVSNVKDGGVY